MISNPLSDQLALADLLPNAGHPRTLRQCELQVTRSSSPESDTLWELEPATNAKHRLYRSYLDAWFPILLQNEYTRRVTYVDAFAGPGEYLGGDQGSPIFAIERLLGHAARTRMRLSRDRVTMIFIEARRDRYEHLMRLLVDKFGALENLPINVVVKRGNAESDLMPLLDKHGAWGNPILAVFDSWGNVSVPWNDMRRIGRNPSSEIIVTFGPNWFSRQEGPSRAQLDAVFGGPEFWTLSDPAWTPEQRWRNWFTTYRSAVIRAGYSYPLMFEVCPSTGQPLYLVFGTAHPKGVEAFKTAMWEVDFENGMRFNDPRTTAGKADAFARVQGSLFEDENAPDQDLLDSVAYALSVKPRTLDEIKEFLQNETPRWLSKHAREAVKYMLADGMIVREDRRGRLTGISGLRLAQ